MGAWPAWRPIWRSIDCGGVGYACRTTSQTPLPPAGGGEGQAVYPPYVREEICELYGFASESELNCFQMLIGVSGVGPKAALSILSAATPEALAMSIITGDEKALTVAPGIGKKIAQRIILELKDKLAKGADCRRRGRATEAAGSPLFRKTSPPRLPPPLRCWGTVRARFTPPCGALIWSGWPWRSYPPGAETNGEGIGGAAVSIDFSQEDFETQQPLVTTSLLREDEGEYSLRPKALSEYIGQKKAKENLSVFIEAAKMRGEPLDHVLLHGPPGWARPPGPASSPTRWG